MHEGEYLMTPIANIKLGQLCRDESGNPVLAVKRGKKNEYEKVPIPYLIETLTAAQYELTSTRQSKIEMI